MYPLFIQTFVDSVSKYGDKTALIFEGRRMTYAELDARSSQMARALQDRGIGRNDIVPILLPRSEEVIVAILGILKSGAAYCALDRNYPEDRIEFILKDCNAKLTLDENLLQELKTGQNSGETEFIMPATSPTDPAVLVYTSGSTGNPKGIVHPHSNLARLAAGSGYLLEENDTYASLSSFSFVANTFELAITLSRGITLLLVEEDCRKDVPKLVELYKREQASVGFLPPQAAAAFLAQADGLLRCILTGSEKIRGLYSEKTKIIAMYGSSESCALVTSFEIDRPYEISTPIGRVGDHDSFISGSKGLLLDDELKPAPKGEMAELFLTGQIGRYWNRPDLNEKCFIENPHTTCEDDRIMYRTGDLCTVDENENLVYNQRKDWMIKVRGYRVEPGEIESAMMRLAPIRQAVVKSFENASGQTELFAVYTAEKETAPQVVLDCVREFLPEYMIPAFVYQIPQLPLNANGKVDRTKIVPPEVGMFQTSYEPPANEREGALCNAFAQVLGLDRIGATDDFVALGGNSLTAAKVQALLPLFKFSVVDILTLRTPRDLAARLVKTEISDQKSTETQPSEKQEYYPLTQNQFGIYVECEQQPDSLIYNLPFLLTFPASTDPERLKTAFKQVVEAHPYLKTILVRREGEILQRRRDDYSFEIETLSCTEAQFAQRKKEFVRPIGLFGDKLFRAEIVKTPVAVCLLVDFHHLIFDGMSSTLFGRDLSLALRGEALSPETCTVFDRALKEQQQQGGVEHEAARKFFEQKLGDGENSTCLFGNNVPERGPSLFVERKLSRQAGERSAKLLGVTPANLFLSALALVLSRFAGTKNVRFSTINNGRDDAEIQNSYGMFVKTFPVVLDVEDEETASQFARRVQNDMYEILKHKEFSFAEIASEFGFKPQINFAFQGGIEGDIEMDGHRVGVEELAENILKFPIDVKIWISGEHYNLTVEYESDRFSADTIHALVDCIAHTVQKLADWRDIRLADLSLLDAAQRKELENVGGKMGTESTDTIPSLFERQARQTPEAPALVASDREFSYAQLNTEANRLAHGLIARGLTLGDRVAFLLPRDSRVIVAMLGILKAGGTYIPIDPEYPAGRINRILENSGARFVLTDCEREDLAVSIPFENVPLPDQTENPNRDIQPDDSAYMIYTSGSTGIPKGVILLHRGIVNYVLPETENRHVTTLLENRCTMLSVTTVSFDMFLKESFTTLMNGLTLVLADADQARDPIALAELFRRTGANAFNATPTRLLQYLEDDHFCDAISSCRVIMSGGEAYTVALYRKLKQKAPDAILVNTYGPTEISVSCNGKILDSETITVGRPLWNVVESIRDHCGHELPRAIPGELWIGGQGVAKGYHGLEDATRERFVLDNGIRYYKSGDLARWTAQGEVAILGRNDRQIKLRGLRIELEEIEKALYAIPGIKSALLRVCEIDGREHLAAWFMSDPAMLEPVPSQLRDRLAETLPAYMLPTAWCHLESIPTTPNGKVDFERLPAPELLDRQEYVEAADEIERCFQEIFMRTLKLDRVGVLDNFFDLGGSSLLVTRILSAAHSASYPVNYGEVFRHPTPRALAELIRNRAPETENETETKVVVQNDLSMPTVDADGFDYSAINELLAKNTIESFRKGEKVPLGNILLTGSTGYLGIHFLKEFLDHETGKVYCLIRRKNSGSENRLKMMLHYYFVDTYERLFGDRIFVQEGDLSDAEAFEACSQLPIDTVVNCAANVRHFAMGNEIAEVNYEGVVRLIEFCKKVGARLLHVSTVSVAGFTSDDQPPTTTLMTEQMFWFGQQLDKAYIGSKFMAERAILSEMVADPDRFVAKIMRVGNLMGRHSDGEFQINLKSNSFVGRFRAYKEVGCIPFEVLTAPTELAPIDCTARAILELAKTPKECCVFHPYNDHDIFIGDVLDALNRYGLNIRHVEREEFVEALHRAAEDEHKAESLTALIAYANPAKGHKTVLLKSKNEYTSQILRRLNFHWPITTDDYLDRFIDGLAGLGFFE